MKIENLGVVLEKTNLEFENQAVLNPACVFKDGAVHMFYRAVKKGNYSSIGYCQLKEGKVVKRLERPLLWPEFFYERHGVEDPRVVELDGLYYMFYTAFDGRNAHAAYATSRDLLTWKKQGVVSPSILYREAISLPKAGKLSQRYYWYEKHYEEALPGNENVLLWEKDVCIFPEKFNGQFLLLHRIMPGVQIMAFRDFSDLTINFWKKYLRQLDQHILLDPKHWYESRKIGVGCPPLKTSLGWLLIYHAIENSPQGRVYHASAAVLATKNPGWVCYRLPQPLFSPVLSEEKVGDVANVVFPTGAYLDGEDLYIFYGAADSRIMAKSLKLPELLEELKKHPQPPTPVAALD